MKQLIRPFKYSFLIALLSLAAWNANAQQLVVNGGFEASTPGVGNSSFPPGWTNVDSSNFSGISNDPTSAHSGMQFAFLGATGMFGSLTQNIATNMGTPYTLSFWLRNRSGIPPNSFDVLLNGVSIGGSFPLVNSPGSLTYTQYTHNFNAATNGTTLEFRYRHDDSFFDLDDVSVLPAAVPALQLTSAASVKTHGATGTFGINLPLAGEPGVECRNTGGGNHTLVFTFNNNVVSGSASVTTGTGSVMGPPTFAGNTMRVNLTGVTDVQRIAVTLSSVTDSSAQVLPNTAVSVNMLSGDAIGNKTVNASDIGQTKGQSGAPVNSANFRTDINANGSVNATDIAQVKANSGNMVP